MQQPQKTAAETITERLGSFMLINKAGVRKTQFINSLAQGRVISGVDGIDPAKNQWFKLAEMTTSKGWAVGRASSVVSIPLPVLPWGRANYR